MQGAIQVLGFFTSRQCGVESDLFYCIIYIVRDADWIITRTKTEAARATNTQQTWRQEFLGSRSSTVERSSTRTAAAGTFLLFLQTIFENTSLWRLKRLVTLSTYSRYINKCIYPSTNYCNVRIS